MELIEMLKQRMDTAGQELSKAQADFNHASQRLAGIKATWDAYRNAYAAEVQATGQPVQASRGADQPMAATNGHNGHSPNVTEFIHSVIVANGAKGMSAVEVWEKVRAGQIDVARNYIYAVLSRLSAKGAITMREHRYFPAGREQ